LIEGIGCMARRGFFLLCLLAICLLSAACGPGTVERKAEEYHVVTDVRGDVVKIPAKPKRIVSVTTGTDEVLLGLVETERMAAVNEAFADPKRSNVSALAQKIPARIVRNPSVETVAALKPDLVLVQEWIPIEKVAALRDLGIPVVTCKTPKCFDDVRATVRLIAAAVDEPERGERLVAMMDEELAALSARIDKAAPEKKGATVALVSIMPAYGGAGCMIDDVFSHAGARNAKALAGNRSGETMTKEQFIACNPDYIFLPSYEDPASKEQQYGAEYMSDPSLQVMKAVRDGHVCYPWAHYIYNISQNVVFGAQEAAYILYGDAFAQPKNRYLSAVPKK